MGMQNQERSRDVQVKQDNCIAVSDCDQRELAEWLDAKLAEAA